MGRSTTSLPVISDTPTSFTLVKDKSLAVGLLKALTRAGALRWFIPDELPTGPEELLIQCLNRWLIPRSRRVERWVDLDASLSLAGDYAVLRIRPVQCGYFAAFDHYYESLSAIGGRFQHAFYSLIHHSLRTLGYIYDLDAARMLEERAMEQREEEEAYRASSCEPEAVADGANDPGGYLNFSKIPESFSKTLPFAESLQVVKAQQSVDPSPVLHALLRLANASRSIETHKATWRWRQAGLGNESYTPEDDGDDLPLILFSFAEHSVIEQAFDEESQYFGELETAPLIRVEYKRGMRIKMLLAQLAPLRHWLHTLTLVADLSKQLETVQPSKKRY